MRAQAREGWWGGPSERGVCRLLRGGGGRVNAINKGDPAQAQTPHEGRDSGDGHGNPFRTKTSFFAIFPHIKAATFPSRMVPVGPFARSWVSRYGDPCLELGPAPSASTPFANARIHSPRPAHAARLWFRSTQHSAGTSNVTLFHHKPTLPSHPLRRCRPPSRRLPPLHLRSRRCRARRAWRSSP